MKINEILDNIKVDKNCRFCKKELQLINNRYLCDCEGFKQETIQRMQSQRQEQETREKREETSKKARLLKMLDIPKRFESANLNDWNMKEGNKIKIHTNNIKENIKEGNGLVLYGTTGTGKTRLSFAIARYIIENANIETISRIKLHNLIADIIDEENGKSNFKRIVKIDVLLIDELGAKEELTDWERLQLYTIIDERSENLLYTIITTNIKQDELKSYVGARIYDRLQENSEFIEFKGNSRRIKNN